MLNRNMKKTNIMEKSTYSFGKSWAKLLKYCKNYLPTIILAILLAVGGTVFTIIGPNKLGEMTSAIEKGLLPML